MTIYASIHGRAGSDPVQSTTANGKDMTRVSIAVNVAGFNVESDETVWVSLIGFGRAAGDLARSAKGQMVTAQGKLTRGHFTGKDGQERESWSLLADAVLVAASARPSGKARTQGETPRGQGQTRDRPPNDARRNEASRQFRDAGAPFDDEISF